jgi:hypothetical protein
VQECPRKPHVDCCCSTNTMQMTPKGYNHWNQDDCAGYQMAAWHSPKSEMKNGGDLLVQSLGVILNSLWWEG